MQAQKVSAMALLLSVCSISLSMAGWSWSNRLPQGNDLHAVWVAGDGAAIAAGDWGTLLRYNPGHEQWTFMNNSVHATLNGVWGSSTSDMFAVGQNGIILHSSGGQWTQMQSCTFKNLNGVWGLGPDDVYAVGELGAIIHWDGSSWQSVYSQNTPSFQAIWGTDSNNIYAVGEYGSVTHWDGVEWLQVLSSTSGEIAFLNSIWGIAADDVFAAGYYFTPYMGNYPMIVHWDGQDWQYIYPPIAQSLHGIWGAGDSDYYVVGEKLAGEGCLLHWNGGDWEEAPLVTDGFISAFYGIDGNASEALIVGSPGTIERKIHALEWQEMSLGTLFDLNNLWGIGTHDVFAVGNAGRLIHWDGAAWETLYSDTDLFFNDVWGTSAHDLFLVGPPGKMIRWDGAQMHVTDTGDQNILYGIWGASTDHVYAVGTGGTIMEWNGAAWNPMDSGTQNNLIDVWGVSENDVVAVGNFGEIRHWNGSGQWSPLVAGVDNNLFFTAIWGQSMNDFYVAADELNPMAGIIYHWDGSSLAEVFRVPGELTAIWGDGSGFVIAVNNDGTVAYRNAGGNWSQTPSGSLKTLHGVWGFSASDLYVGGYSGVILHWDGVPESPNCQALGVHLEMPAASFAPGDPCWLNADVCSPYAASLYTSLGVVLDVYGVYFFFPGWCSYPASCPGGDFDTCYIPFGSSQVNIIPPFTWPEVTNSADGLFFYGAMIDRDKGEVVGDLDTLEFGYHP